MFGTGPISGPGLYVAPTSTAVIDSTIQFGNTPLRNPRQDLGSAAVSYSLIQGGSPGPGNLDLDPLILADPETSCCVEIGLGSPCIDAGNPADVRRDAASPPSLGGPRNDMGAGGGPLAAGWLSWARPALELRVEPSRASCAAAPTEVMFSVHGGLLRRPVGVILEAIGPTTMPVLLGLGEFAMTACWSLTLPPGNACLLPPLTFRAYALDGAGLLVSSNAVVW